jgi:hypothetical protein
MTFQEKELKDFELGFWLAEGKTFLTNVSRAV